MNSVVRQLWEQNTDVVMVDTGNSYEGLCEYVGGKYISYTEEKPITMNPFRINREELNVEKTGFLKNLVLLIWKGSQGTVTKTEDRLYVRDLLRQYNIEEEPLFDRYEENFGWERCADTIA
jgi:type IV secretory pathway VirB4 component